ncbi:hypothetical protein BC828DRAFT_142443 [Blastocladiella britannica]|nr:hypothetical protein BC828DRAFT_142443 [Blastocladiella britannica]
MSVPLSTGSCSCALPKCFPLQYGDLRPCEAIYCRVTVPQLRPPLVLPRIMLEIQVSNPAPKDLISQALTTAFTVHIVPVLSHLRDPAFLAKCRGALAHADKLASGLGALLCARSTRTLQDAKERDGNAPPPHELGNPDAVARVVSATLVWPLLRDAVVAATHQSHLVSSSSPSAIPIGPDVGDLMVVDDPFSPNPLPTDIFPMEARSNVLMSPPYPTPASQDPFGG